MRVLLDSFCEHRRRAVLVGLTKNWLWDRSKYPCLASVVPVKIASKHGRKYASKLYIYTKGKTEFYVIFFNLEGYIWR